MLSEAASPRRPLAAAKGLGPDVTLSSVFSDRPTETFAPGAGLVWEGDPARHVFEVVEGVLRIFRIIGDGRRAITGFLYPGDILGVSMRDRYLYSAEAVNAVKVRRFSAASFQQAIHLSPELRPQFFAKLCDEMAGAQEQMVMLSRKNAEERICTFLLRLADRGAGDRSDNLEIDVPMTRLDMADYLGLTIETVSRTITSLIGRGVISQRGRHDMRINKFSMLARLAGDGDCMGGSGTGEPYSRQAVWPA